MADRETFRQSDQTAPQLQPDNTDSPIQKIAREAYVIGVAPITGAAKDGYKSITEHPGETGLAVAGTFAIGLGLSYLSRGAGMAGLVARGAGAALGVQFVRAVASPQRWSVVRDTLADTWSNKQNFERNVKTMESSLGPFVFDTTLMLGAGVAGARLGEGLQTRIASRGTKALDSKLAAGETAIPMSARLPELDPGKFLGHRFSADGRAGEAPSQNVIASVREPVKPNSLPEPIQPQRDLLVAHDDVPGLEARLGTEATRARQEADALNAEVRSLMQELHTAKAEMEAFEKRLDKYENLYQARVDAGKLEYYLQKELPEMEARLRSWEEQLAAEQKIKEGAATSQGSDGGQDTAGRLDDRSLQWLTKEITRMRADVNEADPNSVISRARARLSEERQAFLAAEGVPDERMTDLVATVKKLDRQLPRKMHHSAKADALVEQIALIQAELRLKQAAPGDLSAQLTDALTKYDAWVTSYWRR